MKILWTEPAIEDLRNLHGYIARDSEIYASSFVQRIILAVDKLSDFPRIGRTVPEADQESIREIIYRNYRIIYRIKDGLIQILSVIHGSRDLASFELFPWE